MIRLLLLCLLLHFWQPALAAKIDDVDGTDGIVVADKNEVFKVGDYLFVLNKKGKRRGVLRVSSDRGAMYDVKVVYGKPKIGSEVRVMTKSQRRRVLAYLKSKKVNKKGGYQENAEADPAVDMYASEAELQANEDAPEDFTAEASPQGAVDKTFNLSLDLLPLAGDAFGVKLLNGAIEYRVKKGLSVGGKFLLGDISFEGVAPPGGFPTLSYLGIGGVAVYSFAGQVYGNGLYVAGYLTLVKEEWSTTPSFSGLAENGIFAGIAGGYQYWIGRLNFRFALKLNYSSLGASVVEDSFTYARDGTTTGISIQPTILVGYAF